MVRADLERFLNTVTCRWVTLRSTYGSKKQERFLWNSEAIWCQMNYCKMNDRTLQISASVCSLLEGFSLRSSPTTGQVPTRCHSQLLNNQPARKTECHNNQEHLWCCNHPLIHYLDRENKQHINVSTKAVLIINIFSKSRVITSINKTKGRVLYLKVSDKVSQEKNNVYMYNL